MASWLIRGAGCVRREERLAFDSFIIGRGLPQALQPFLDPAQRTANLIGVLLAGPIRMSVEEFAQVGTISNQVGFFHGDDSKPREKCLPGVYT